jgi:CHAD domain-containing protein
LQGSPITDRSTPLLKRQITAVFKPLPRAMSGSEDDIHDMRVAARRLRVGLPLLARKPAGRRVRRALALLRALTRTAGGSRDLDVSLALYDARLHGLRRSAAQGLLRRRLAAARARSRARMAEALLDLEIAGLRRHLRAVIARRGEPAFTVAMRLRQARDAQGAALRAGCLELAGRFLPEPLHRLRIQARILRYTAEVGDLLRGRPSGAQAALRELQELLGQIHDCDVLARWLEAQAATSRARGQRALAAAAAAEAAFFAAAAREHHRSYLARGPVALLDTGLQAMGATRLLTATPRPTPRAS